MKPGGRGRTPRRPGPPAPTPRRWRQGAARPKKKPKSEVDPRIGGDPSCGSGTPWTSTRNRRPLAPASRRGRAWLTPPSSDLDHPIVVGSSCGSETPWTSTRKWNPPRTTPASPGTGGRSKRVLQARIWPIRPWSSPPSGAGRPGPARESRSTPRPPPGRRRPLRTRIWTKRSWPSPTPPAGAGRPGYRRPLEYPAGPVSRPQGWHRALLGPGAHVRPTPSAPLARAGAAGRGQSRRPSSVGPRAPATAKHQNAVRRVSPGPGCSADKAPVRSHRAQARLGHGRGLARPRPARPEPGLHSGPMVSRDPRPSGSRAAAPARTRSWSSDRPGMGELCANPHLAIYREAVVLVSELESTPRRRTPPGL